MKNKGKVVSIIITIIYSLGLGIYAFVSSANTKVDFCGFDFKIPIMVGTIFLLIGSLCIIRSVFNEKTKIHNLYLGMAIVIYSLLLWTMPPLHGHDICFHFDSSYVMSNKLLRIEVEGWESGNNNLSGYLIREEDRCLEFSEFYNYVEVYAKAQEDMLGNSKVKKAELVYTDTFQGEVSVPMYFYIPQAIGFTIARLLNLNVFWLLYLGRLCMCAVCIAITYMAIKNIPFGKEFLLVCGMIPTTLLSCASISRDALILASSFYFIAKCLQIAYVDKKQSWREYFLLFASLILLVPYKLVYIPFIILLGLLVYKNGKSRKWNKKHLFVGACILLLVAVIFIIINYNYLKMYITGVNSYSMGEDSPFTVPYVLANLGQTVEVIIKTLMTSVVRYYANMIAIGDFGGGIHKEMVIVDTLCIIILVLATYNKDKTNRIKVTIVERLIMILTWVSVAGMVMLAFLLCTPHTNDVIIGIQGRYFTPVLPLVILGFCNFDGVKFKNSKYWNYVVKVLDKVMVKRTMLLGVYAVSLFVVVNMYVWVVTYM